MLPPHVQAALSVLGDALSSSGLAFFIRTREAPWAVKMSTGDVHGVTGHVGSAFEAPTFWRGHVHPGDRDRVLDRLADAASDGSGATILDYRLLDRSGGVRAVREVVRPLETRAGTVFLGVVVPEPAAEDRASADPAEGPRATVEGPGDDEGSRSAPRIPRVAEPREPRPSSLRILAVEDEPAVRSVMLRSLARRGHSVVAVGSARAALQAFDRSRPGFDVVVCDVVLPDRSGVELVGALRRRQRDLPVLYTSGYGERTVEEHGVRLDREPFISKPFTQDELIRAIFRALGQGGTAMPDGGVSGG